MKKLIFINDRSFLEKDYDRYGIEYFLKKNITIELWQINEIVNSKIDFSILDFENILIKNITDKSQFKYEISKIEKNSQFIMLISPNYLNNFIFDIMHTLEHNWSHLKLAIYPPSRYKFYQKIQLALLNPFLPWNQIVIKIKSFFLNNRLKYTPNSIFVSGNFLKNNLEDGDTNKANLISCNAFDYDKYLNYEEKDSIKNSSKEEYILYLDNNLSKHQDAALNFYSEKNCKPDIFYKELNNFFDYIEELNNCRVIVAAYPKADYKKSGNPFNNREIVFKKTIEKVKHAKLVLIHNSTSVNFAAIYKIPIIFISSIHYSLGMRVSIEAMAIEFSQTPIDISKNYKNVLSNEIKINERIHSNYVNKFIVSSDSDSINKYSYEIVYSSLFSNN